MTESPADAGIRLARAAEGIHLNARRLRHELDRVLAECGSDDLLQLETREASRILVTTSSLLMVLQADVLEVLEARAMVSERLLADARTVVAALRAQMDGHEGKRPPSTKTGADKLPRAG